jgi:tRNA pseudouridine13 synthase
MKVIKSAIEKMGWKRGLEKDLLQALERYGETNYYQAINSLNRNLKTIFGHSYQSLLFNMLVNKRLEMNRNGLLVGDLVMGDGNQITEITDANIEECESKGLFKSLILPIIGYDVKIPSNVEQFVNGVLKEHGIDVQSFDHKNREFKLGGTYRKVFVTLTEALSYDYVKYPKTENVELQTPEGNWLTPEIPENAETLTALRIRISLPSSCYATIAIRELLRFPDVTKSF